MSFPLSLPWIQKILAGVWLWWRQGERYSCHSYHMLSLSSTSCPYSQENYFIEFTCSNFSYWGRMSSGLAPLTHGPTVHKHSRVNSRPVLFLLCTTCRQNGLLDLKIEGKNRRQQSSSCLELQWKYLRFLHCNTTMISSAVKAIGCESYLHFSDILSPEYHCTSWKEMPYVNVFQLVVSEGRKEESVSVYQKALIYCLYIVSPINRWTLFIVQRWNILPISHNGIT